MDPSLNQMEPSYGRISIQTLIFIYLFMYLFVMHQVFCQTCSEKELLYFLDMRFLMVSLTDLTFLPREIRDVVGDLTTSL